MSAPHGLLDQELCYTICLSKFKMWLAFSTNWTAEPVFSKRLEMPLQKSSRWKRRFSAFFCLINRPNVFCQLPSSLRSPFERRARPPSPLRPRSHRKDNLLDYQAFAWATSSFSIIENSDLVLRWNVCSSSLARVKCCAIWNETTSKDSQGSWIHQGHKMAIPLISFPVQEQRFLLILPKPQSQASGSLSVWTIG